MMPLSWMGNVIHVTSLGPAADAIVYTLRNLTISGIFSLTQPSLHHLTSSTATTTTVCAPAHCDTLSDTIDSSFTRATTFC
ncbi:hypothetical protein WAI453_005862 [Rhynchosporium graminicola]